MKIQNAHCQKKNKTGCKSVEFERTLSPAPARVHVLLWVVYDSVGIAGLLSGSVC